MNKSPIIGWDVGGAHLKAAMLNAEGNLLRVLQVPCALWRGLNELEVAIDEVLSQFSTSAAIHAITMTGELVDLFANRQTGVNEISHVMHAKLAGAKLFYTGASDLDFAGFVTIDEVNAHWQHIASANWLASAGFVAKQVGHALFIDIGSTTSDFVLIAEHQPVCLGLTDAARMQTEELVYTGVIRTPLMALTQKIQFEDTVTSVAAEYFAATADVYRLTDDLVGEDDMTDTADGKEKTVYASTKRLARMIGHDADDKPLDTWVALAQAFKQQQVSRLQEVATKHISRVKNNTKLSIIGAGAGSFIAREIAESMKLPYLDVADLIANSQSSNDCELKHWATVCLPAYAVANLAFHNNQMQ
ncbi:hydantoinase/oxoprolinase family protein [Methylotenera versatilis]|uniref:H4MPT-linked C1 transfer pathway protein n=1 Tax=Methylotenera versatilis (strain 301) TaxID=666681 RepID=D7DIN8_METV0|nr:hydantoinase/oxoprolinase family protein [Methylotenera versatilis]ADI29923.1 H4MPT-linked C1 transfer pathway protein [Methylotenera versatilis 301]